MAKPRTFDCSGVFLYHLQCNLAATFSKWYQSFTLDTIARKLLESVGNKNSDVGLRNTVQSLTNKSKKYYLFAPVDSTSRSQYINEQNVLQIYVQWKYFYESPTKKIFNYEMTMECFSSLLTTVLTSWTILNLKFEVEEYEYFYLVHDFADHVLEFLQGTPLYTNVLF